MVRVPSIALPEGAVRGQHRVRVIFGDTDALGIVYYANYLRYFEAGRAALMREIGLPYAPLLAEGVILPVVEQWWRYRSPARYDDPLLVETWVHELGRASVLVGCQIHREDREGLVLIGEGAARLGCIDADGRPRRLPEAMRRFGPAG